MVSVSHATGWLGLLAALGVTPLAQAEDATHRAPPAEHSRAGTAPAAPTDGASSTETEAAPGDAERAGVRVPSEGAEPEPSEPSAATEPRDEEASAALIEAEEVPAIPAPEGALPAATRPHLPTAFVLPVLIATSAGWRAPRPSDGPVYAEAERLVETLEESLVDFGFSPERPAGPTPKGETETELLELARRGWVFAPRLERAAASPGQQWTLSLLAGVPGARALLVREGDVTLGRLNLQAVVYVRDIVKTGEGFGACVAGVAAPGAVPALAALPRSSGRAVLAISAAAFGGYVGYTLQRAGGSADTRLTYPMLALGAGVGVGASMLIAGEWNVTVADAWYLTGAAAWPTLGTALIARSYDVSVPDTLAYGLLGGGTGLALATVALGTGSVDDGGAVLTNSGGALFTILGGLTELLIRGDADASTMRGMGYGALVGVVGAGFAATQLRVSSSRILLVDLGATIGALAGAAAASPLIVEKDRTPTGDRLWATSATAGFVAGGLVAWWLSDDEHDHTAALGLPRLSAGLVGVSRDPKGEATPVVGLSLSGLW